MTEVTKNPELDNVDPEDVAGSVSDTDTDGEDGGEELLTATDLPAFMYLSREDVKALSDEEKLMYLNEATKHMIARHFQI